jgi:hypothetical protein
MLQSFCGAQLLPKQVWNCALRRGWLGAKIKIMFAQMAGSPIASLCYEGA